MKSDTTPPVRRVMSSNGRVWHTNAQGASDYLFNPVFMTFFILCVVLYATLMQPSEETQLPIPAQMILWGGLIMTSLLWLFFSVWASVVAHDRGLLKAIYTPLLLLPLVMINSFMGEFVLSVFNTEFQGSYGSRLENILQNSIILVAFDIMHARFVAPQHPRYVDVAAAAASPSAAQAPSTFQAPSPAQASVAHVDVAQRPVVPETAQSPTEQPKVVAAELEPPQYIVVAREKIDAPAIVWVKSEDHYLAFQLKDRNLMLRGKLRMVVDELGDSLGCQINRSVWVAYDAVRSVEEHKSGNLEVYLDDDTVFRVSSSRRLIFMQNYDRFKASNESLVANG